tara:strand:+ start:6164 stop:6430 length:267 start_codon:yes stop_codon:yes gene_type:complete
VIAMDHYINGRSLTDAIEIFPGLMERAFQRRVSLNIPFLSRAFEPTASCLADGLYSAENLEAVAKASACLWPRSADIHPTVYSPTTTA